MGWRKSSASDATRATRKRRMANEVRGVQGYQARAGVPAQWPGKRGSMPVLRLTHQERFWLRVNKDGPVPAARPELGPCWLWTAPPHSAGYSQISVNGRRVFGHRFAYTILVGPIPFGLELDHLCRTPLCVNPRHLEAVTHRVNMLRGLTVGALAAGRTECIRGHPLAGDNLYVSPNGHRQCRSCRKVSRAISYAKEGHRPRRNE